MWIVADDFAVLAGAGLGFIGIDDEKAGTAVLAFLGHERPFHPGRESRTAATAQARRLDFLDDRVLPARHQVFRVVPVATLLRAIQTPVLKAVEVGEDAILVS